MALRLDRPGDSEAAGFAAMISASADVTRTGLTKADDDFIEKLCELIRVRNAINLIADSAQLPPREIREALTAEFGDLEPLSIRDIALREVETNAWLLHETSVTFVFSNDDGGLVGEPAVEYLTQWSLRCTNPLVRERSHNKFEQFLSDRRAKIAAIKLATAPGVERELLP